MKNPELFIWNRGVGLDYPPLIIAELWINHWWSLDVAKEMVDVAFEAWAEIIKHQTHIIEDEMSPEAKNVIPGNADISIYDIMSKCALSEAEEFELMSYIQSKWMIFISTPFSRAAANRLEKFWVLAYKIWSGECNNYPLIKHIASFGKPIILSTWMNSIQSIQKAVDIFREYKVPYWLMHCTNVYPTPPELVRLNAMIELNVNFPDAVIWLSDHTTSNYACLWAVALGASILERHFTDSKTRIWPDIICSMDWSDLKELILGASVLAKCRWWHKWPVSEEDPCIKFAFATVVSIKDIKEWDVLSEDNIWVKRPWTWKIPAENYFQILWKKALIDMPNWYHLAPNDFN